MTVLKVAAKWVLFALVAFFVGRVIVRRLCAISWAELAFAPHFVVCAVALLFGSLSMQAVAWRSLLQSASCPLNWRKAFSLWLPQMGKYVPGKAATVVGAFWLLGRYGVPRRMAAGIVFIRTGIVITVGLLIAAPLTLWEPVRSVLPQAWLWCLLLVAAGAVLLHPKVFVRVANFFLRKLGRKTVQSVPGLHHYAAPVLAAGAQWALAGASLWFLARSLGHMPPTYLPLLMSASAMAMTFGFLAFFAPAGLGVREGIYLVILTPLMGQGAAAVAVLAARAVQVLVELSLAGVGLLCMRRELRAGP